MVIQKQEIQLPNTQFISLFNNKIYSHDNPHIFQQGRLLGCSYITSPWLNFTFDVSFLCAPVKLLSRVQLIATPWTVAYQAPPSMGFSRQEYWSGLPLPSPYHLSSLLNSLHFCSFPLRILHSSPMHCSSKTLNSLASFVQAIFSPILFS